MGTQTMGSQVVGGGQRSQFRTLGRQVSPYGFSLNEVQIQLGDPMQCMSLDELLSNVQDPEEDRPFTINLETRSSRGKAGSFLQGEGSVILPKSLDKKTVDEVWRDIQQGKGKCADPQRSAQEKHPALGEITLEDFLAKVGVAAEESKNNSDDRGEDLVNPVDSMVVSQRHAAGVHWLQQFNPMPSSHLQQVEQSTVGAYASSLTALQPDNQNNISTSVRVVSSDSQTRGRKRVAPEEVVERTVERRQKRMIKNRESAARSRARKQAYTNELENKIARLEEENERLKRQKKLERLLHHIPPPEPKSRLRRTSSARF